MTDITPLAHSPDWVPDIHERQPGELQIGGTPNLALDEGLANVQAQQLASRTAFLKLKVELASPAGVGLIWFHNVPPTGWLECDGAAINRVSYADLFAAIGTIFGAGDGLTTFNLPDMRGEFLRGWDNGRNADAARVFGSQQAHMIAQLKVTKNISQASTPATDEIYNPSIGSSNNTGVANLQGTGPGFETRPRNVAVMFCIKY